MSVLIKGITLEQFYKDLNNVRDMDVGWDVAELPPHGRLVDADKFKEEFPHDEDWDYPVNTNSYVVETIDKSPTIIEAEEIR